jgi:hypothetical protein
MENEYKKAKPWEIKSIYEKFRKRVTPGYSCGSKFDDVWIRLCNLLYEQKTCPILYLESLFETKTGWEGVPYPHLLFGPIALKKYNEYLLKNTTIGELEFNNEIRRLNEYQKIYSGNNAKTIDEILFIEQLPMKSYTRVMLCSENVLEEVKQMYAKKATLEIDSNPSLKKYIKENYVSRYTRLFPQGFSVSDSGTHDTLPKPSSTFERGQNIPRRRKLAHT